MVMVSIGVVAKKFGVTCQTIRNWTREGYLHANRTPGNHRRYDLEEVEKLFPSKSNEEKSTVLYSRVSSYDQKADLHRQKSELQEYCESQKITQIIELEDIGSGLNYKKKA